MNPNINDQTNNPVAPESSPQRSDFERSFEESIRTASSPPPAESSRKFFMVIGGLAALVALLAGAIWYLSTNPAGGSIPLKEYVGDSFSILVPEDYEKKVGKIGERIEFKEPGDAGTQSIETVGTLDVSSLGSQRDRVISQTDKSLRQKNKLSEAIDSKLSQETTDYTLTEIEVEGQEARKISATAVKDGKKIGMIYMMIVYGTDKFYYVSILAHIDDNDLNDSVDTIFSSFRMKQATV